jgi:hypothetical protein
MQIKKIVLASLLCLVSTPLFANVDWSTYYGNSARTSSIPIVTHPENYHVLWEMPYANATSRFADIFGVVIADGKLFYVLHAESQGENINAAISINVENGVQLWNMTFDKMIYSPFYQDSKLLLTEYRDKWSKSLIALRNDKPKLIYETKLPAYTQTITPDGQTAYLNIEDITLGGYDTTFGQLNWAEKVTWGRHIDSLFAISKDYIASKSFDGFLVFNRRTGKEAYKFWIENTLFDFPDKKYAPPLVNVRTQTAYALFTDDDLANSGKLKQQATLYALDLATQKLKWKLPKQTDTIQPALSGDLMFSVEVDFSKLNVINNNFGTILWSWTPPADDSIYKFSLITATADTIFISTAKRVYAISIATHATVFSYDAAAFNLALGEGKLFIFHNRKNPATQYLITAIALY